MAAITLIEADSATQSGKADLIFADPPFDLPGDVLAEILQRYDAPLSLIHICPATRATSKPS